jgi:two-component system, OmpR family, sensor kinase
MADRQQVKQKWRPPLSWIAAAVLLGVLALPTAIVLWFYAISYPATRMGPVEAAAIGFAVVLTLIIAVVFSRTITGPINALIRTTEAIGRGGMAPVPPPDQHGTREIAVLSQSFLDLAARLVERTAYVHSFAAHVSHELKSPLTSIRGSAELLLDETIAPADRKRFAEHIIADSDRLAALLERLRVLARAEVPLDARGVTLRHAAEQLQLKFPSLDVAVDGDADVPMALSQEAAFVIFTQLADNALQHGARKFALRGVSADGSVRVFASDNGAGIPPGNRDRVFEPFFTTRRDEGGTGMGLEIVRTMLAAHGGAISLGDSAAGAAFEIVIPRQM